MKLFGKGGKLNIIDLLIILILVAAIALVCVRLFSDKTETLGSENAITQPNLRFTVLVEDIHPELAAQVVTALTGDPTDIGGNTVEMTRLFNSNKLVDAKVLSHEITTADDGTTELRLTVEAAAVVSGGAYSVGTQEVRVGKEFNVKTLNVEIKGTVLTMEKLG